VPALLSHVCKSDLNFSTLAWCECCKDQTVF